MSSALTIASVTAVLKSLLDNGLMRQSSIMSIGDISVTTLPPDRIPIGTEERTQLNLYLYRVTPNVALSRPIIGNPPSEPRAIALDLHYLLTAYGERDFQAELLLGYAIQIFYATPVLSPELIRSILQPPSVNGNHRMVPPALAMLSPSTLAKQVVPIKLSAEFLSVEDISKLWSTLQAHARLSVTYQVSTVVINADPVFAQSVAIEGVTS